MVLSVSISPNAEAKLKEKAAAAGLDLETYAARHLERVAGVPIKVEDFAGPPVDMTEDELSDFLEAEKHAARAERRKQNGE